MKLGEEEDEEDTKHVSDALDDEPEIQETKHVAQDSDNESRISKHKFVIPSIKSQIMPIMNDAKSSMAHSEEKHSIPVHDDTDSSNDVDDEDKKKNDKLEDEDVTKKTKLKSSISIHDDYEEKGSGGEASGHRESAKKVKTKKSQKKHGKNITPSESQRQKYKAKKKQNEKRVAKVSFCILLQVQRI